MRRFVMLIVAGVVAGCALWADGTPTSHAAAPVQKKRPPKKKGQNDVDGALWSFVATNRQGKQIRFRYRASDLVLYDPDTNAVIGKSEPITPERSRVTLNDKSEFPGTFEIRKKEGPHWRGQSDSQGDPWTIELRGLVR